MAIQAFYPHSEVWLSKVPLSFDTENQIGFSSASEQFSYFTGSSVSALNLTSNGVPYSYVRKDGILKVNLSYEKACEYNYVTIRQTSADSSPEVRVIYSFVIAAEYDNPNCTILSIATDLFQTYQYWDGVALSSLMKPCWIERETVADDTVFANVLPEPIDTGEQIYDTISKSASVSLSTTSNSDFDKKYMVCIACTGDKILNILKCHDTTLTSLTDLEPYINRMGNSIVYFGFSSAQYAKETLVAIGGFSDAAADAFVVPPESIIGIFAVPRPSTVAGTTVNNFLTANVGWSESGGRQTGLGGFTIQGNAIYLLANNVPSIEESIPLINVESGGAGQMLGYTPRNKKLYNSPFTYIEFTNGVGDALTLKPENFLDHTHAKVQYNFILSPTPQLVGKIISYNHSTGDIYDNALTFSNFPNMPYNTDGYNQYWAQHKGEIIASRTARIVGSITGVGNVLASGTAQQERFSTIQKGTDSDYRLLSAEAGMKAAKITTGASLATAAINVGLTAAQIAGEQRDLHNLPDSTHGEVSDFAAQACGFADFSFRRITCRVEFLRRIDRFFDLFGYYVHRFSVPTWNKRMKWDYIQTLGCNIAIHIPQQDRVNLQAIFDNGLRIWHGASNYLNYGTERDDGTQVNPIASSS